jgi:hypothetical protein
MPTAKGRLVLELHDWKDMGLDDESDIIALFLFTLMPVSERTSGVKPGAAHGFWTEVRLSRDLASRGRWAGLSKKDKLKAMFRFAQERIQEAGRKLRQAPMYWTPMSPLRDGPPWSLAEIAFPKAPPLVFEPRAPEESPSLLARKSAGL